MSILVTGGCGFIGSNCLNYFLEKYPDKQFVNVDKLDYCANEHNVKNYKNYTFVYGNITDATLVSHLLQKYNVAVVIHFAAQTHVDNSFGNSLHFTEDNVMGTHTLLECAKEYGKLEQFIHISTDEVYGEVDTDHAGCCEKSLLNPTNPYAATKAAAEFLVKAYHTSFKVPIKITRANNVYGPNQYPEKLIPKFITQLKNKEKCTIHGKGETRRNFIHAVDVARAIDVIWHKGEINQVYNIGTKNEYSVNEIFQMLCKHFYPNDSPADHCEYVADRPFNDFRYAINCDMLKALGWAETIPFEEGFASIVKHYRDACS